MTGFAADPVRVVVVGTSGSGKTTFSKVLSSRLGVPHIELDALHWGPNWTAKPRDMFRADTSVAIKAPTWVCDGNYSAVRDLVWARANTLIWLDYSFPVIFYRAVTRTLRRLVTREELFAGNRERLGLMFDPDWIPWWVLRTYHRRRREYPALVRSPPFEHLEVLRFRKPSEAAHFLDSLQR